MAQRKRRTRTAHPGVKLRTRKRSGGATTHYARFDDPDTGTATDVNLTRLGLTNAEARRDWAIRKSTAINQRRADLAAGARPHRRVELSEAARSYLDDRKLELKEKTLCGYTHAIDLFIDWAARKGVRLTDDLTGAHLEEFRTSRIKCPRQGVARGGRRGERRLQARPRSAYSVTRELRAVGTMLNTWRRLDLLPHLDSDGIRDGLRAPKGKRPVPTYLRSDAARELLEAASRHDGDRFTLTREEHDGLKPPGSTPPPPAYRSVRSCGTAHGRSFRRTFPVAMGRR